MTRPPDEFPEDGAPPARPVPPHGVADWPGRRDGPARPEALPDGRPWPRVRVLTFARADNPDLPDTIASVLAQDYAPVRHEVVPAAAAEAAIGAALADPATDHVLFLRSGDLLAPGALTALCLEAALTGAAAVAGLRVLFDRTVAGLDVPSLAGEETGAGIPFTGGEVLFARRALAAAGADPAPAESASAAWLRLSHAGAPLARIGRPVLLQRRPEADLPREPGLSIVSLTGSGYQGGAGIAQRRLAEALALAGHRLTHRALADESPPASAEWTDRFPRAEAAILGGGHDLVLAGNLHGATRSLDVLGRLAARLPVAAVLHDLFPLTGRCAYPKDCTRIAAGCDAACPTPDQYPELRRGRIASVHAAKRRILDAPRAPLLLANSAWTAARARDYAPPGAGIAEITLAFPTGVFRPADRRSLRRGLGLPEDDCLIVFSAVIVDAPDKGFPDLVAALHRVARPGVGFVAIGRLDDPGALGLPNLFAPGPVAEEASLAAWYGACDLHVTASRVETLGQTPVEAGLCGTPTLAYAATGLTSAVIDGVSGRLVPPEPGALAEALEGLVADAAERERLGAFARIALEGRFSHASAAMRLDEVLRDEGLLPASGERLRFPPAMLGRFAFAAERHPGAGATVPAPSHALVRRLRRAKQALFGRSMPYWIRRALSVSARLRQGIRALGMAR